MAKRTLFLVRHGQYTPTVTPPDEPDGGLTAAGTEQAILTAERLQSYPIRVIHHSTLQRAQETAVIIAQSLPEAVLKPSSLLRECIPNVPQGFESYFSHIPPAFIESSSIRAQQTFNSYIAAPPPDGADDTDQYELIVSHGNLINYLVCQTLQAPAESWLNADIQHCGLSEIVIESGGWVKVARHNDTGHLPFHLQTFH